MKKIEFQVSAKTARLIGRENISDVSGALLELIKNGYDADADCSLIKLSIPFLSIPEKLTYSQKEQYFSNIDFDSYYDIGNGEYVLKSKLDSEILEKLTNYILSLCKIYIVDNGCGMSYETLTTTWMNIGTNDKEVNIYSEKKKRIKTGAKGIGRFALDKLSTKTSVITKTEKGKCYEWTINWNQFDKASLLGQVKAVLNDYEIDFKTTINNIFGDLSNNYTWESGTLIILNPLREFWDIHNFEILCNNLQNINPYNSVDKFEVKINNEYYSKYSFDSSDNLISSDNYDYNITADYDGFNGITINLSRNEIDIEKKSVNIKLPDNTLREYSLDSFWSKELFKNAKYNKNDYSNTVTFNYSISDIPSFENYNSKTIKELGKFSLNLFYSKNTKSTVEIVKSFNLRERKQILRNYSGIKIYRDGFKMKGYGDAGVFKDWLQLSERVAKSPAAASHQQGYWRVIPNQIFGYVSISRIDNKNLYDNANREGMAINSTYSLFVDIIHFIISKFEFDRQRPLREFAAWTEQIKKPFIQKDVDTFSAVKEEKELGKKNESLTTEQLKDAVYYLGKYRENDIATQQLLMVLSSVGVLAQTFAHEISNIGTDLGSRGQLLESSINYILDGKEYEGDEDFNPYTRLERLNKTDLLLSEWVQIMMDSVKQDHFVVNNISLSEFLLHIEVLWKNLLDKKKIKIENKIDMDNLIIAVPLVDLHLIVNNFILNSAYFLEQSETARIITFHLYESDGNIILDMENTGPELDSRYNNEPDRIFEPRESTKIINGQEGTGLGLWIAKEAVLRNNGEIHTVPVKDAFLIRITWQKKEIL
ncbi:MAG: ATP-binding protein [Treponema sp.]|nr:ATP-binding protein [Treponema sp.]